ncbi:hypothetical protein E4U41_000503 [Claviceps citrina]|nr:hypothetical protein E4U41_000503 [Claviceps citrina]
MAGDTTPKKKEPTAQEAMFFFAIVKHTRNKADIDWNAVAVEQGFKNADVAKVRFGQVKRKLGISSDAPVVATPPSASRTPTKKAPSVASTPSRVVKATGRVGTKGKALGRIVKKNPDDDDGLNNNDNGHRYDDDDDDDDETVVGVKDEQEVDEEGYGEDADLHAEVQSMPRKAKSAPSAGGAAAAAEGDGPLSGLTETETRFIKAVFDNMTQKPDANWDSVAADLGLKDAKCAKDRFRQISVRHGWRDQPGGNGSASPRKGGVTRPSGDGKVGKRAPRTPTKKSVKSAALVGDEDDESPAVKAEAEAEAEAEVALNGGETEVKAEC